MSVEGSTPLSHNFIDNNEKAAVAISDVTDYLQNYEMFCFSLNMNLNYSFNYLE